MKKLLLIGFLLGIATAIGLTGFVAPINHKYEASLTRVAENSGRIETFVIDLPQDRLLSLSGDIVARESVPKELAMPEGLRLAASRVEVFRLRDANHTVIGLASRMSDEAAQAVDWTLYMPARGALFLTADEQRDPFAALDIETAGSVVGGSESMQQQYGRYAERWVVGSQTEDGGRRIEIETNILVAGS